MFSTGSNTKHSTYRLEIDKALVGYLVLHRWRSISLTNPTCIFCRIIKGELPSYKLYEDPDCLIILDVNPITAGHSLIISKMHYQSLLDTSPDLIAKIMQTAHKVIPALLKTTNTEGFNLFQNNGRCAGQLIPHLHFHIIPRAGGDNVRFNWNTQPADKAGLEKLTTKITQYLAT